MMDFDVKQRLSFELLMLCPIHEVLLWISPSLSLGGNRLRDLVGLDANGVLLDVIVIGVGLETRFGVLLSLGKDVLVFTLMMVVKGLLMTVSFVGGIRGVLVVVMVIREV